MSLQAWYIALSSSFGSANRQETSRSIHRKTRSLHDQLIPGYVQCTNIGDTFPVDWILMSLHISIHVLPFTVWIETFLLVYWCKLSLQSLNDMISYFYGYFFPQILEGLADQRGRTCLSPIIACYMTAQHTASYPWVVMQLLKTWTLNSINLKFTWP